MNSIKAVIGKVNIINNIYFDMISMILCLYLQLLTELNVKSEYGTSAGVFVLKVGRCFSVAETQTMV